MAFISPYVGSVLGPRYTFHATGRHKILEREGNSSGSCGVGLLTTQPRDDGARYGRTPSGDDRHSVADLETARGGPSVPVQGKRASRGRDSAAELVNLCHDLRQYVSAGLLLSKMPGDENLEPSVRERLDLLHQQLTHTADLIAAARADVTPRRWEIDLASLVADCVKLVQLTHVVTIDVNTGRRPVAYGDPVLTRRALVNLLDNAARAVGQDGTVTVTLGEDDTMAWVEVADTGLGFGQISSGSGHGLSIVHAAARASGGRLEISSGPGPGTRVRMVLVTRLDGRPAS